MPIIENIYGNSRTQFRLTHSYIKDCLHRNKDSEVLYSAPNYYRERPAVECGKHTQEWPAE